MNELLISEGVLKSWVREFVYDDNGLVNVPALRELYLHGSIQSQIDIFRALEKANKPFAVTDLLLSEFREQYEFGKYPNTRLWLKHFAEQGFELTRKDLYVYISKSDGSVFERRNSKALPKVNVY